MFLCRGLMIACLSLISATSKPVVVMVSLFEQFQRTTSRGDNCFGRGVDLPEATAGLPHASGRIAILWPRPILDGHKRDCQHDDEVGQGGREGQRRVQIPPVWTEVDRALRF